MKAYKGFNKDMTCRGFQYAEGQSYEMDGEPEVCERGFHACANPIECLGYYAPGKSVYHEVELDDVKKSDSDTKCAATKIKIGARLSIPALCQAAFDFVRSHCTNEKNAEPGKPATAGSYGAATAGSSGAATAGDSGAATSRGSVSVGANGIGCVRGNNVRAKGGVGAILVIAEEFTHNYDLAHHATITIDGKHYKPDTWYCLNDKGRVVKAPAEGGAE